MAELLAPEVRSWLLGELARVISLRGAGTFLEALILEPTPRHFPDPFEASEQGVRVLLRRLLGYAGLDGLEVELGTFSAPDEVRELDDHGRAKAWGHEGAAAMFHGVEAGRCVFSVAEERIGEPVTLVATLCHEVTHAWRAVHGLVAEDHDLEEQLTDLSTVYLGFGLLTTNGAYLYRASSEYEGAQAFNRWSHTRAGYLPPEAMSFLLAAQVRARGLGWWARSRLAGKLETNQAAYFKWACSVLGDGAAVRDALGMPEA